MLLFQRPRWQALLAGFAPVGRMALSSYLMQTLVGSFVFFGFGLGLLGRYGNSVTLPIGIAVVAAPGLALPLWLEHFRFGPVEWAVALAHLAAAPAVPDQPAGSPGA